MSKADIVSIACEALVHYCACFLRKESMQFASLKHFFEELTVKPAAYQCD